MLAAKVVFRDATPRRYDLRATRRGSRIARRRRDDSTQAIKIEKVKEHIGAIATGVDLAHPIDGATQKKLYDAIVENVVP